MERLHGQAAIVHLRASGGTGRRSATPRRGRRVPKNNRRIGGDFGQLGKWHGSPDPWQVGTRVSRPVPRNRQRWFVVVDPVASGMPRCPA